MKDHIKKLVAEGYSKSQAEMMCRMMKQQGGIQSQQEEQMEGSNSNPQEESGEIDMNQIAQQIAQALQGGADPQQILQQLVSMGLEQNQATQLIQGVMQQMQTPQQEMMQQAGTWYDNNPNYFFKNFQPNLGIYPQNDLNYPTKGSYANGQANPQQGIMLDPNDMSQETYIPSDEMKKRMAENRIQNTMTNNYDENGNPIDTSEKNYVDKLTYFNPNSQIDMLNYGAYQLGKGNTQNGVLGLVGGGLGLLRNTLSGYGLGKEEKRVTKEAKDKIYGYQNDYELQQQGGKDDWISKKIQKLEHENSGRSHKQNIAIAFSMYEQSKKQEGGSMINGYDNIQKPIQDIKYNVSTNGMREGNLPDTQLYTKVYYKDGTVDYIKPQAEIENEFKRMPNYIQYMNRKKTTAPNNAIAQMEQGGKTVADLITGEYKLPTDRENSNVEIEKGEITKDGETGEIQEALGKPHEEGGTPVNLPNGTEILSDHTKVGVENAKMFSEKFGFKVSAKDTFATVLDKATSKLGIKDMNEQQADIAKKAEKVLDKENVDETTQNLNKEFISKQLTDIEAKKEPLLETRKAIFDMLFKEQEKIPKTNTEYNTAQEGGKIVELANKYGISPERAMELATMKAQQGTTVDTNPETDYTNTPSDATWLPYKSVLKVNKDIWKGDNYKNSWIPLVDKSMGTEEKAKKIDEYLTNYSGQYAENVKSQLKGLSGKDRYARIKQLATDTKPGIFHNAVLEAIKVTQPDTAGEVATPQTVTRNKVVFPDFSNSIIIPPSAPQSVYKEDVRFPYLEPKAQSPILVEEARNRMAALNQLSYLPDEQKAAMQAQILAGGQQSINQIVGDVTQKNANNQFAVDQFNVNTEAKNRMMQAKNITDYQGKVFAGQNAFERNLQNYYNYHNMENALNTLNFNKMKAYNALNENQKVVNGDIMFEDSGYKFISNMGMTEADKINKMPEKDKAKYIKSLIEMGKLKKVT